MIPILEQLMKEIEEFHTKFEKMPVVPDVKPQEIRKHLASNYDFKQPVSIESILSDISSMMRQWTVNVTHPRYFGLFNPAVTLASVMADTLVALYNPQLAAWSHAPAANEIEKFTLNLLLSQFGFDTKSSIANFTTGGAEANLSGVLVALTDKFPEYGDKGFIGFQSRPLIYLSEEAHHSFQKIAHITGLGREAIRVIDTDSDLKLDLNDLNNKFIEDKRQGCSPFILIGTAGTTSAGVIDHLDKLAEFCQETNLWFHVDAAWGGAAVLSPRLKPHLKGVESADSITCDAHKWFSVPMGAGMFFCKNKQAVERAFAIKTGYMPGKTVDALDPYVTTIQWSRRFIGLKVFMTIAELGIPGLCKLIEQQTEMGDELRRCLRNKGWKIVNHTPLPTICFTHDKIEKGVITPQSVLDKLYKDKSVWISQVILKSTPALRACITNFRTEKKDIDYLVSELDKIIAEA